jgi:hypothetical protein
LRLGPPDYLPYPLYFHPNGICSNGVTKEAK